jgi:hypothetical protein
LGIPHVSRAVLDRDDLARRALEPADRAVPVVRFERPADFFAIISSRTACARDGVRIRFMHGSTNVRRVRD